MGTTLVHEIYILYSQAELIRRFRSAITVKKFWKPNAVELECNLNFELKHHVEQWLLVRFAPGGSG